MGAFLLGLSLRSGFSIGSGLSLGFLLGLPPCCPRALDLILWDLAEIRGIFFGKSEKGKVIYRDATGGRLATNINKKKRFRHFGGTGQLWWSLIGQLTLILNALNLQLFLYF